MQKSYLGDGVYAAFDGYHVVLTTENGIAVTNTIFLEPDVIEHLKRYVELLQKEVANASRGSDSR